MVLAEPGGFVMPDRVLHLRDVVRNDESVRLAGRLECVVARRSDPVVLEVAPPSAQREGMHRSGMTVARQHARGPNPQNVDVVAWLTFRTSGLNATVSDCWTHSRSSPSSSSAEPTNTSGTMPAG